ncbi:MAG: kdsC [Anaerosporomusa subterranea]|nr:kdsC [Anaerosporomusa subterranea]
MDRVDRARQIRLLVLDVDGVLTNNQLIFGNDGEILKVFHSQDGLGIAAAHKAGLKTAIITGRNSEMVRRRGEELKIGDLYQGSMDKVSALNELLSKHRLTLENIAYVGDDLNASHEGGRGAVREIIEYILKAQDKWDWVVEQYMAVGPIETQQ